MNQHEKAVCTINGLRFTIAQTLIATLNNHWIEAAFGRCPARWDKVDYLVRCIREHAQKIVSICQDHSNSSPWIEVKSKKRRREQSDHHLPNKTAKVEEEIQKHPQLMTQTRE